MYTIKQAAERVGVSEASLRAWERRYGIGPTRRTEAGYRIYDDGAIDALVAMRDLIAEGWAVHAAAEEVRGRFVPTSQPVTREPRTDELADVAARLDVIGTSALLDQRFAGASFETVVDGWLLPALEELGDAWADGRVSVAGEHLVAHSVTRRLAAAFDAAGEKSTGPRVVLGLPPGARHDLGMLAFATSVRRSGLAAAYLGADVPVADWVAAVTEAATAAVVLSAPTDDDVPALRQTADAIAVAAPDLLIAVGGAHQDSAPDRCLRLGHQIGPAVALLIRSLQPASGPHPTPGSRKASS